MQLRSRHGVVTAIVQTVAYVDIFDYPLRPEEVHRYLIGTPASLATVQELLADSRLAPRQLARHEGYVTLPGRQRIVETRRRRETLARRLWPLARHYGSLIAGLPFVRMVAVTGSLAVNNADPGADIDYLIVTSNDRLWLCRALTILIVRLAARRGVTLCPNYLLSERALVFPEQNLYTAHELVQMVPLSGHHVYRRIRRLNPWTNRWLPNASGSPQSGDHLPPKTQREHPHFQRLLERGLDNALGRRLDQWEMARKLARFSREAASNPNPTALEAQFSADWCKGHFDGHARQIMDAYRERVRTLGVES